MQACMNYIFWLTSSIPFIVALEAKFGVQLKMVLQTLVGLLVFGFRPFFFGHELG